MVRAAVIVIAATATAFASSRGDDGDVRFLDQVAPILVDRCLSCHNPKRPLGGFRVDTYARLRTDSDSGRTIEPGQPDDSLFYLLVEANEPSLRMPKGTEALPPTEVATLRRWIEQGAGRGELDPEANLAELVDRTRKNRDRRRNARDLASKTPGSPSSSGGERK